jgi:acyl carrier protein
VTRDEVRAAVLEVLAGIAPEADAASLRPDVSLRDQMDLDSIDVLNFVIGIDQRLHVQVPETDYAAIVTLDGCVDYVWSALQRAGPPP